MLPGWGGGGSAFDTAKAQYEAAGFTVHAFDLNDGKHSGDTWERADVVEAYIAANGLTSVQIDGHSLGGTLVYELIRVRRNPAIVSAVTRDSNIHGPATNGAYCWEGVGVPDQCFFDPFGNPLPVRASVLAAPLADVPVLNVSALGTALPDVDCNKVRNISHNAFLTDTQTTAWAIAWAQGRNPCSPTPSTPTATSTLAPSSTPTATPAFTSTVSPSPTSTPLPTSTPSSCLWWQRLFGWC